MGVISRLASLSWRDTVWACSFVGFQVPQHLENTIICDVDGRHLGMVGGRSRRSGIFRIQGVEDGGVLLIEDFCFAFGA